TRALLEAGDYIDDAALLELREAGEYTDDPQAYLSGREGWYLDDDGNSHYVAMQAGDYTAADLVLCQSPDGWSFHAPESTDEEIASGDARYILTGPGRPTSEDRERAFRLWSIEIGDIVES